MSTVAFSGGEADDRGGGKCPITLGDTAAVRWFVLLLQESLNYSRRRRRILLGFVAPNIVLVRLSVA